MIKRYIGAIWVTRQVLLWVFVTVITVACISQIPSVKSWADPVIGTPISKVIETVQRPGGYVSESGKLIRKYQLRNGNFAYINPIRDDCDVHWEVNSSGIIIGYRMEGARCF
jgi:hypothetical protein